ncbi:MAG: hypothetical protein ACWA44_00010 [Thiotrichales bacterium]
MAFVPIFPEEQELVDPVITVNEFGECSLRLTQGCGAGKDYSIGQRHKTEPAQAGCS